MLVSRRMQKKPVTVSPEDHLATVQKKMKEGGFRRTPVVENGRLVGIVTDKDLRQHLGYLDRTKVNVAMSEKLVTVLPKNTLEEASQLLLKHKIGGLPVVEDGQLVGIITTSDILQAFLDVMGVSEKGTFRIDLLLEGDGHDLASASQIITGKGGEILGVGTYREKWEGSPVFYLRLRGGTPNRVAAILKEEGFEVLGVQP